MLTIKQNLLETIKGGNPDRFVNQYEAFDCSPVSPFGMIYNDPVVADSAFPMPGGPNVVDSWGVTRAWPANVPGQFPVHDDEHKVLKDITQWEKIVKAPKLDHSQSEWDKYKPQLDDINKNEVFSTIFGAPGLFEQVHYLTGIDDALIAFYEEPEALKELIAYITEWKLGYAKLLCELFFLVVTKCYDSRGVHGQSTFYVFINQGFKRIKIGMKNMAMKGMYDNFHIFSFGTTRTT